MVVAVGIPDTRNASTLVQRLMTVVGGEAVSMAANGEDVRVDATAEPSRTLASTMSEVEAWLADLGRPYTMQR
jgi:hypothetical protein